MATKYWTNANANGDWSVAGNWSPSGVPVTGDDVFIEQGSDAIIAGLNQTAVNLASLRISFMGSIGTSTTPLTISCSGNVVITGGGSMYKINAGTSGISKLIFNPKMNSNCFLGGGTFTTVEAARVGLLDIDAACVVTNLYANGCGITIGANATAITLIENTLSVMQSYRGVTTLRVGPSASYTSKGTAAAIGTSTVEPMGRLNHQSQSTITTSIVKPDGIATAVGNVYAFTVTNRTNYVGYAANFDKGETARITFTNAVSAIGMEA